MRYHLSTDHQEIIGAPCGYLILVVNHQQYTSTGGIGSGELSHLINLLLTLIK